MRRLLALTFALPLLAQNAEIGSLASREHAQTIRSVIERKQPEYAQFRSLSTSRLGLCDTVLLVYDNKPDPAYLHIERTDCDTGRVLFRYQDVGVDGPSRHDQLWEGEWVYLSDLNPEMRRHQITHIESMIEDVRSRFASYTPTEQDPCQVPGP